LTPHLLEEALAVFKNRWGYLPRVIVAHMNPPWEAVIRRELAEVERRLGIEILISRADTKVDI
jgi:hypothetical protein